MIYTDACVIRVIDIANDGRIAVSIEHSISNDVVYLAVEAAETLAEDLGDMIARAKAE